MTKRRWGANRRKKAGERVQRLRHRTHKAGRHLMVCAAALGAVVAVAAVWTAQAPRVREWLRDLPAMKVHSVEVTGAEHVGRAGALTAAGISAGMYAGDIDPAQVAAMVKKLPWVEEAVVKRGWFGRVSMNVRERRPIAIVNLGSVYQTDREGVLLDIPAGATIKLPVVCGLADTLVQGLHRLREPDARRMRNFLAGAQAAEPALCGRITQVDFSDSGVVRLSLQECAAVVELEEADPGVRMSQLQRLLRSLSAEAGAVRSINLRYANVAYVRTHEGSLSGM